MIGGTTQHPRDQVRRGFVFRFRTDCRGDLDRIPRLWHSCNTGKAQKVSPVTEVDNNQALRSESSRCTNGCTNAGNLVLPSVPSFISGRGGGLLSAFAPTTKASVTTPTQTPSAPTRSEEAHRVGVSRRAILSRDGRTLTRRRPSRREMRACGASFRKRPRRPGVAQAVADGVNSPRVLLGLFI